MEKDLNMLYYRPYLFDIGNKTDYTLFRDLDTIYMYAIEFGEPVASDINKMIKWLTSTYKVSRSDITIDPNRIWVSFKIQDNTYFSKLKTAVEYLKISQAKEILKWMDMFFPNWKRNMENVINDMQKIYLHSPFYIGNSEFYWDDGVSSIKKVGDKALNNNDRIKIVNWLQQTYGIRKIVMKNNHTLTIADDSTYLEIIDRIIQKWHNINATKMVEPFKSEWFGDVIINVKKMMEQKYGLYFKKLNSCLNNIFKLYDKNSYPKIMEDVELLLTHKQINPSYSLICIIINGNNEKLVGIYHTDTLKVKNNNIVAESIRKDYINVIANWAQEKFGGELFLLDNGIVVSSSEYVQHLDQIISCIMEYLHLFLNPLEYERIQFSTFSKNSFPILDQVFRLLHRFFIQGKQI